MNLEDAKDILYPILPEKPKMRDVVTLDKDAVIEVFATRVIQEDVLIDLFKMVYPDWDLIDKIQGYPVCNKWTSKRLTSMFMDFDREHHSHIMPGGLWMNFGFTSIPYEFCPEPDRLADWQVAPCPHVTFICPKKFAWAGESDEQEREEREESKDE